MKTILHKFSQLIEIISVLMFCVLFALVVIQMGARIAGVNGFSWTDEMISCFTTWMAMLGAAYIAERKQHIQVTMFIDGIKGILNRIIYAFIEILNVVCGAGIGYSGWIWFKSSVGKVTPVMQIQYNIWYIAITVFGVLYTIFSLGKMVEAFVAVVKPNEATE